MLVWILLCSWADPGPTRKPKPRTVCAASPPRRTHLPPSRSSPSYHCRVETCLARHGRTPAVRLAAIAVAVALLTAPARGVELRLDAESIGRAVALGQTAFVADLDRFHQPYRVDVKTPPVDYLEIVTPFRRIVLTAQARSRAGDRRFGQREALEIEAAAPRQIDLFAELTFHPLNTFVLVPSYRIRVLLPSGTLDPRNVNGMPRYGPRVNGGLVPYTPTPLPGGQLPGRTQPMLGATIVASFDGDTLTRACDRRCNVVIEEEGKTRVQVPLSLASLR